MSAAHDLAAMVLQRQLWIFDLDGTLADTSPIHARAFAEVLAPHGVKVDYDRVAGLKTEHAIELFFREQGVALSPTLRDRLTADKRNRARVLIASGLAPIKGAEAVLGQAGDRAVALCSSGSRGTVTATLTAIGLADRFIPIVTADDVRAAKPDPEGFLAVLDRHGTHPDAAVVFEDSAAGLAAAQAAGIVAIKIMPTGPVAQASGQWRTSWPALATAIGVTA